MERSIRVKEVYDFLCRWAPPSLAEDWDHVGLQVGSLRSRVKGILISLDVTEAVLREAEQKGANLLITHHPLFLKRKKRLTASPTALKLKTLARRKKIDILSFHTNLDAVRGGLNDLLAETLRLKKLRPLIPHPKFSGMGLGRLGLIQKTTFKNFVKRVEKSFSLKNFRYTGHPRWPIRKVAVMSGSGGGFFLEAKRVGAHVLVTGDVKYHHALDALSEGIALVDIGHFAGEIGMVDWVARKLQAWIREKKVSWKISKTQAQSDPFRFYSFC